MLLASQRAIVDEQRGLDGRRSSTPTRICCAIRAMRDGMRCASRCGTRRDCWRMGRVDVALRPHRRGLGLQFDQPGTVWDGTWPRAPEEPQPRDGAVIWRDYDPNWRQFIGCVLGVLLRDYAHVLGPARCAAHRRRDRARDPRRAGVRIVASYSNIALMQAWLLCEYGDRRTASVWPRMSNGLLSTKAVSGVQLADVLRRRPVGAGVVAALGFAVAGRGRAASGGGAVARCRSVLSPWTAQSVRSVRPRVWHGHDAVCVAARVVDVVGCGDDARRSLTPAPVRARARLLRNAAVRACTANDRR